MFKVKQYVFHILNRVVLFFAHITRRGVLVVRKICGMAFAEFGNASQIPQQFYMPYYNRRTRREYWRRRRKIAQMGAITHNSHNRKNGGEGSRASKKEEQQIDFLSDIPIKNPNDDILGRGKFVEHLSNAIIEWEGTESIVIAICGEWGSGKSSIINLTAKKIRDSNDKDKPIVIKFNPWGFSGKEGLVKHFFNEIAKELLNEKIIDSVIYETFIDYGEVLSEVPAVGRFFAVVHKIAKIRKNKKESVLTIKNKIKEALSNKSIVIVIDDIDRLNQSEIKQIFRLIKVNADFPNIIYLLALDKAVITENLDEQKGISGKDYMDKIVQLDFDIPAVSQSKISNYFLGELNEFLQIRIGETIEQYALNDNLHWYEVYDDGVKHFLRNIRDAKRLLNGLKFNLPQAHYKNKMEVDVVDFIAIESIRIFVPDFYAYMKNNKVLFCSVHKSEESEYDVKRIKEIKERIGKILSNEEDQKVFFHLINTLFPTLGYSNHTSDSISRMNSLRICSEERFSAYFTLIPGGDENELSQFEIQRIWENTKSKDDFEKALNGYIEEGNIIKILEMFKVHSPNPNKNISENQVKNIIHVLFNFYDNIMNIASANKTEYRILIIGIIFHLLNREDDKQKNFEIIKESIFSSKGVLGPVQFCCSRIRSTMIDNLVQRNKIEETRKLGIQKIQKIQNDNINVLLENSSLRDIMGVLHKSNEHETWRGVVEKVKQDDKNLLIFISKFINPINSPPQDYEYLSRFLDEDMTRGHLEKIKNQNLSLYEKYKGVIDFFLENSDRQDER